MNELEVLFNLDNDIRETRKHLRELEQEREARLAGILSRKIERVDPYILYPVTKKMRVPDVKRFQDILGDEFSRFVRIRLDLADKYLSKEVVESACTLEDRVSYRVIELR